MRKFLFRSRRRRGDALFCSGCRLLHGAGDSPVSAAKRFGQPSLGYDVRNRKLVIEETEATTVRMIFQRYVELKSVRDLKTELDAAGIVSMARRGPMAHPMAASGLGAERSTRCCRTGSIPARSLTKVTLILASIRRSSRRRSSKKTVDRKDRASRHNQDLSPLTGLLFDADGERLTPSHALKKGVRYRCYVSRHLITGDKTEAAECGCRRLPSRL